MKKLKDALCKGKPLTDELKMLTEISQENKTTNQVSYSKVDARFPYQDHDCVNAYLLRHKTKTIEIYYCFGSEGQLIDKQVNN